MTNTEKVFLALLRAGLWEQEVFLQPYEPVDFNAVYKLAEEQSVTGLIAGGIEQIKDIRLKKLEVRPFLIKSISIERRNSSMNEFVSWLFKRLREEGISPVLVKGQGVAQCYARPQWRAAGDIDLFLSDSDYSKSKEVLKPISTSVDDEVAVKKHIGMQLSGFEVELHGTLKALISNRWDKCLADIQDDIFNMREVRTWNNDGVDIYLPKADNDIVLIFSHFLKHFYKGGIGLRQVCDWCRLIYTYHDSINIHLLGARLQRMDVMPEWKAFASLAVDYLGMPKEFIPFYEKSRGNSRKASQILSIIFETGNFGHNKDTSYYRKHSYLIIKFISFFRWVKEYARSFIIFPRNTLRVFWRMLTFGLSVTAQGK